MDSNTVKKIRKSYEKYRATIQEWIKSGKYERWQFADNEYTDFETYIVAYMRKPPPRKEKKNT